eukprot:COSAG01_NODE_1013_length_12138_cov_7.073926_5_plen_235_part_00
MAPDSAAAEDEGAGSDEDHESGSSSSSDDSDSSDDALVVVTIEKEGRLGLMFPRESAPLVVASVERSSPAATAEAELGVELTGMALLRVGSGGDDGGDEDLRGLPYGAAMALLRQHAAAARPITLTLGRGGGGEAAAGARAQAQAAQKLAMLARRSRRQLQGASHRVREAARQAQLLASEVACQAAAENQRRQAATAAQEGAGGAGADGGGGGPALGGSDHDEQQGQVTRAPLN